MKLETWASLASLGLSVMFVAIMLSFYNFLIGPEGEGPERVVDPGALLYQEIFISAVPSMILAGFVFFYSRTLGNRAVGLILAAAGIVMIAGMAAATTLVARIPDQYIVGGIDSAPNLFMAAGAGIAGVGAYLAARSGKRFSHDDLERFR